MKLSKMKIGATAVVGQLTKDDLDPIRKWLTFLEDLRESLDTTLADLKHHSSAPTGDAPLVRDMRHQLRHYKDTFDDLKDTVKKDISTVETEYALMLEAVNG